MFNENFILQQKEFGSIPDNVVKLFYVISYYLHEKTKMKPFPCYFFHFQQCPKPLIKKSKENYYFLYARHHFTIT